MSRALLAIGVSRAAGLAPLPGAAADAQAVFDWAVAQGYEHCRLLVDAQGRPVAFADVAGAVSELMAHGDLERLVIYFSGHGYAPLPQCETLLLSNWESDANEAINLTYSVVYARLYKSPQISIIVDACRTTWSTPAPILGQVIFKRLPAGEPGKVDEFYATQFGDASQEANGPDAFGLFSRELLKALHGRAPEALEARDGGHVVTSSSLERYLEEAVPEASELVPGAKVQHPDVNGKWRAPSDVYVAVAGDVAASHPMDAAHAEFARPRVEIRSREGRHRAEATAARRERVERATKSIEALEGRASFETAAGVTIVGARIDEVYPPVPAHDIFAENGAWHVRLPSGALGTRLIRIADAGAWNDHWLVAAVFPQRIAAARIDEQGFSALNYRLSRQHLPASGLDERSKRLEAALTEATAALLSGALPAPARVQEIIDTLREDKATNPALAVVAAHICQRIGDPGPVNEMASFYEIGGGPYTPYDLALIADAPPAPGRTVVGACPLMSRGWALLSPHHAPRDLFEASRALAPSLWTLMRPAGAEILKPLIPIP